MLYSRARSDRNQNSSSTNNPDGGRASNGSVPTNNPGGNNSVSGNPPAVSSDRDSFSRWRDRQYFGPRRWFQNAREDGQWEKDAESKKKELCSGMPLWISDELEVWPEKDGPLRFTHIASLHSEFIAISIKGELHQWRWSDSEPYRNLEVIFFAKL